MANLFSHKLLQENIKNVTIPELEEKIAVLQSWVTAITTKSIYKKTESECEQAFNLDIFHNVLGYTFYPTEQYTLEAKGGNEVSGQKADATLGYFHASEIEKNVSLVQVAVEIKDANTSLTKSQRREGNLSPIQQGFKYKPQYNNCKWVIVTNFVEIRLFKDTQLDYELWNLVDLVNPDNDYQNFKMFWYLLNAKHLISNIGESRTEQTLSAVRTKAEQITKDFYKHYKSLRFELINDIRKQNTRFSLDTIVQKSQKIIDRLVFAFFCEDNGLLPQGKIKDYIEKARGLGFAPRELLIKVFKGIDSGNDMLDIPKPGYNGGLFHTDNLLDSLIISDTICQKFIDLGEYDFKEELSVNILGHIFEQSISDLEEIRIDLLGKKIKTKELGESTKSNKRKKDGIFYTPEYIVDYIVKNSLGKYLEEQFEIIEKKHLKNEKQMKDKTYDTKQQDIYREYQMVLSQVKVLDPACGSGAFLVRVFDYLIEENVRVMNVLSNYLMEENGKVMNILSQGNTGFIDTYVLAKDILTRNIYGVDLNAESVEITKLSLWLKTAEKGKKLADLDNNIKCGNSLIDDPSVAGEKAFDWSKEFAEIMSTGGFDVIVGNPPYFNVQTFGARSKDVDFLKNYYHEIWMDKSDILFYFFHKAINICKGKIAFITSNAFLFSDKALKLRNYLLTESNIEKIINFEQFQIFLDASITSCITVLDNIKSHKTKAIVIPEKNYSVSELSNLIAEKGYITELKKNCVFSLTNKSTEILNQKIDGSGVFLGGILKVGKGMETASNEVYSFSTKPNFPESYLRKRLNGEAINRYYLNDVLTERLLYVDNKDSYDELDRGVQNHLNDNKNKLLKRATVKNEGRLWRKYSRPMHKDYYHFDKIRCSYRAKDNSFVYDDTGKYIGLTNTTVIFGDNSDFNLKYILSLLNSSLLNRRYKSIGKQTGSGVYEYFENQITKLPIKKITLSKQKPFIGKVDQMLLFNKQLQEKIDFTLRFFQSKFAIEKLSTKLQKFRELDFAGFLKELKIKKLPLDTEAELMRFFEKEKAETLALKAQIDVVDREIDDMVFDLYGLSEEERRVVLGG